MGKRKVVLGAVQRLPPLLRLPATRLLCRLQSRVSVLDPAMFKGQRVLIIGPARTITDDLAAIDTGRFDVIVKMNNGLDTPVTTLGDDRLRCDVLFHSLTRDARPVTPEKLQQAKVRILVHRTPTRSALLRTLIACEDFGEVCPEVRYLPQDHYAALVHAIAGFSPTTGLLCASFFLAAPVQEVAIMGFTFFQTRYAIGYDDEVGTDAQAVARIAAAAHHAPDREAIVLAERVQQARQRGVTVTLGRNVVAAMMPPDQG